MSPLDAAIIEAQRHALSFEIDWDAYEAAVANVAFHAGITTGEAWDLVERGPIVQADR